MRIGEPEQTGLRVELERFRRLAALDQIQVDVAEPSGRLVGLVLDDGESIDAGKSAEADLVLAATIYCRKTEIRLSWPHAEILRFRMPRLPDSVRTPSTDKRAAKILVAEIPHKPLKRLDSDERIQGNPGNPIAANGGFRSEKAMSQENPNDPARACVKKLVALVE